VYESFERQIFDYLAEYVIHRSVAINAAATARYMGKRRRGAAERLSAIREGLNKIDDIPVLGDVARLELKYLPLIDQAIRNIMISDPDGEKDREWFTLLKTAIKDASTKASERISAIDYIALRCSELSNVEYEFPL